VTGRTWAPLLCTVAVAFLVWGAAAELPAPARLWTTALVVVLPVLMIRQASLEEQALALPRAAIYLQSGVLLWAMAGVTAVVARTSGIAPSQLGLRGAGPLVLGGAAAATFAVGLVFVLIADRLGLEDPPLVRHLLPHTRSEHLGFAALSLTAGFCEELVFRGFLIHTLERASGMLWLALLLSSGLFGVLHAYQRPAGAARAAALGMLLAAPLVLTANLWPSIVAHASLDLAAGFWLRDRPLR